MPIDEEVLAERLLSGVRALREGRPAEAAALLEAVASDPSLQAADTLQDVRARACSLTAQALADAGRPRDAERWVLEAWRLLDGSTDKSARDEVRTLLTRVRSAVADDAKAQRLARRAAQVADMPVDELLAAADTPVARAEVLLEKANAELEVGRSDDAARFAMMSLDIAQKHDALRQEILARLCIASAAPERAERELTDAWRRAERADAFNLVGAVARAAEVAGVALPTLHGPDTSRSD